MENLINQIEQSLNTGMYFLSLMSALTLPDIAGAMDDDGTASPAKYKAWYDKYVLKQVDLLMRKKLQQVGFQQDDIDKIPTFNSPLNGEDVYKFRCSLLHQGRMVGKSKKLIFIEPGQTTNSTHYNCYGNDIYDIDVDSFVLEILAGAREWLRIVENSQRFQNNYNQFARRHPSGYQNHLGGVVVIA